MEKLTPKEQTKREALRKKKPLVYDKVIKLAERAEKGIPTPLIDFAYSYVCDLHCPHCLATSISPQKRKLTVEKLRDITTQGDRLGLCQLVLSGGEPLIFKDLDAAIEALQPDKFHIKMSTHGRHLDKEMGKRLSRLGVDKVCISLDSFHGDTFFSSDDRSKYPQPVEALFTVKENGMDAVAATVVTKESCYDPYLVRLAEFATKHDFKLDVYLAKPIGQWQGRFDLMLGAAEYKHLEALHEQFPVLFVDTFPSYGIKRGCGAIRSTMHINPYGDVFPCPFIQVAIGNIFEENLEDIIKRGMSIKHFNKRSPVCLSGRNANFMRSIQGKNGAESFPPSWKDVFLDDFVS